MRNSNSKYLKNGGEFNKKKVLKGTLEDWVKILEKTSDLSKYI